LNQLLVNPEAEGRPPSTAHIDALLDERHFVASRRDGYRSGDSSSM